MPYGSGTGWFGRKSSPGAKAGGVAKPALPAAASKASPAAKPAAKPVSRAKSAVGQIKRGIARIGGKGR